MSNKLIDHPALYWQEFETELESFQNDLEWLLAENALNEDAEVFYRGYLEQGHELLELKPIPKLLEEGKWDDTYNFRSGYTAIRGTIGEMLVESLCYLGHAPIDQRISKKERQTYGEDLIIQGFSTSVKIRTHYPTLTEGQADTRLVFWRNDFLPAKWRVARLVLVDHHSRRITIFDYPRLAKQFCTVDSRGFFTPTFNAKSTSALMSKIENKEPGCFHTFNLREALEEAKKSKS